MPEIYLYAEVLLNIRQVTLYASLKTTRNEHTKIEISSDKNIVTVIHDGESAQLYLPTQIAGNASVTIPSEKKKDLSVRLEIEDVSKLKAADPQMSTSISPWSAEEMSGEMALRCKSCDAVFVESGVVRHWHDLPSENWFEMMDYWHCHRPHAEEDGGAEESKIVETPIVDEHLQRAKAKPGTGLVDAAHFIFATEDCRGIEAQATRKTEGDIRLCCSSCSRVVGQFDPKTRGNLLSKGRVAVQSFGSTDWMSYPTAIFVVAQLLLLVESQAARKFVIQDDTGDSERSGLLLWVFNPDIYYSSSERGPTAHRAMKAFYRRLDNPQKTLDEDQTLESVRLPAEDLDDLTGDLLGSTTLLPQAARQFQDWDVGLLDRWGMSPTEIMDLNLFNQKASPMSTFPEGIERIEGMEGLEGLLG